MKVNGKDTSSLPEITVGIFIGRPAFFTHCKSALGES